MHTHSYKLTHRYISRTLIYTHKHAHLPLLFSLWPKSTHQQSVPHKQTSSQSQKLVLYTQAHAHAHTILNSYFSKLTFKQFGQKIGRQTWHKQTHVGCKHSAMSFSLKALEVIRVLITTFDTNRDKHAGLFHHGDVIWTWLSSALLFPAVHFTHTHQRSSRTFPLKLKIKRWFLKFSNPNTSLRQVAEEKGVTRANACCALRLPVWMYGGCWCVRLGKMLS